MSVLRLDNVAIVVPDLEAAIEFFVALGLEIEGRARIEGIWADRTVGLDGVRSEIAMLRTPDGLGRLELTAYVTPPSIAPADAAPPSNTLGLHRVMYAVDDLDATIARLAPLGGELLDGIGEYEDLYRLCYLRGPGGIIVALAEAVSDDGGVA